ncbi:hypothetical protein Tco_1065287 [Tanacetum coccineum]
MPNVDIPLGMDTGGSPKRQKTIGGAPAQTRSKRVLKHLNEPPFPEGHTSGSGEGRMEHTFELMDIVPPTPHDSPLPGGYTPGSDEVNTAGEGVSTAAPRTPPTTTTVFDDKDVTMVMAQTLIKMNEEKDKDKGVAIKDVEDSSRPIRSITTLQPLPTIDPKDKGKGILQDTEHVEKKKKKVQGNAQIERDAEVALRLLAELDEELRVERERQEEASKVAITEMFDEVQARIDVDYELAARMTQKEQEKYTIEERVGLLAEFYERRKKQLAAERAEAIRNKPPTKT